MSKRALCIGINDYPGTNMDLEGCVNDASDWARVLSSRGFAVQTLLNAQATKAVMVAEIRSLVQGATRGDTVVITYAGHGTYVPDEGGDEVDGFDEGLCPHDIKVGNVLLDDEIHQLFAGRTAGVTIVVLSDSCHSGTIVRAAPTDPDADASRPRFMPMAAWLPESRLPRAAEGNPLSHVSLTSTTSPWAGAIRLGESADLLLSGCAEGPNCFSYDTKIGGRSNGAFTYYALKALKTLNPTSTYAEWHAEVRKALPSASYPQSPQIVGTKAARNNKVFV